MSAKNGTDPAHRFPHKIGDVVLVKWRDGKIYFAKIKTIDWNKKRCVVIFDDKSQDLARFSWIHDVNETTTDIICVKCKQDSSDKGNEIVLCDQCGYGYHQKCHEVRITQQALDDDSTWVCYFCDQDMACPYVANADVLAQSLEDIDDQPGHESIEKIKIKKKRHGSKVTMETSKKYSTGLLAASPTVEQAGEEEAVGEHYTEQTSHGSSGKPQKAQSRRKSKPYKVEIRSSVSKEYFVDNEELDTSTSSRGRKIKRKTPHRDA
ncbi:uncharacterized protein, partial [Dysidea avara]|uniref:uncharacterized protein n=1 Tax=Dysidea avara TaxID=196820 RepID=UPI00331877C6